MHTVEKIHKSNLYGIIIELGCSAAISNKLMNVPGASNTVYKSVQPYSKEYQAELYGEFKRSVSKDSVKTILEVEAEKVKDNNKINFILATSWQLADPSDKLVYAHGWFGLYDIQRNVKHYLHYSFKRSFMNVEFIEYSWNKIREKYFLNTISDIAVGILQTAIDGNIEEINQVIADKAILDMAYINDDVNYHLLINTLEKAEGDYFIVFDKNDVIRFEDLMRKNDKFVIQKGSFNPIHHGHIKVMEESIKYEEALPAFLISTFRYDKPHIDYNELSERIEMMSKLDYPLIICKSIYFYQTFQLINDWAINKSFNFPIGIDTLNRIYETDHSFCNGINVKTQIAKTIAKYRDNFKFLVFKRNGFTAHKDVDDFYNDIIEYMEYEDDGISSTKIRNGEMENKIVL